MKEIVTFKIHPAIGIARLGNSPNDFFIGPEIPGKYPKPEGGYKDSQQKVKRQAARFRIFGYDKKGKVVKEITAKDATIKWTVHLANKKSAWKRFEGLEKNTSLRNATIPRSQLEIDPGSRSLSSVNAVAKFDTGKFMDKKVPLGEIHTDNKGRLLVLGGFGKSKSALLDNPILDFANNDGWHDDVSDGPVNAAITLKGSAKTFNASGSWVVCAPPDFAPSIANAITLYDTLLQVAVDKLAYKLPRKPSFVNDIRPILERANNMRWVCNLVEMHMASHPAAEGDSHHGNTDDHNNNHHHDEDLPPHHSLDVAINSPIPAEARKAIFKKLRNPDSPTDQATEGSDMPMIHNDYDNEANEPLTRIQYEIMSIQKTITPEGLDRAALESCAGAAFYPGIEASWMIRDTYKFAEAFRLDQTNRTAGDITKQMAVPWQADFYDCKQQDELAWWPAQRPDQVFPSRGGEQVPWTRDHAGSYELMTKNWHKLGFVIKKGTSFVESERNP
jgi:hypothetical protein